MATNLYNPSFKTKQIYSLNINPSETPNQNEMYYWLTYENGKIYSNFRINGVNGDKKYEITDPVSFNPEVSFQNKVKSIRYNKQNQTLTYYDEVSSYDVLLSDILTADSISIDEQTNVMSFSVSNNSVYTLSMPDVYKKHIVSGLYNATSKSLVFTYNDATSMNIDVTALAKNYDGTATSTITTNIANDVVSSDLKISMVEGNQIQVKSDGIYVPAFDNANLEDFAMQSDLDDYVLKITGKGLSTEDFTTALKTKLQNLSITNGTGLSVSVSNGAYTIGLDTSNAVNGQVLVKTSNGVEWKDSGDNYKSGVKIEFTSSNSTNVTWNNNTATFTHGLNCYPIVAIYDNNMTQALYGVKVLNGNQVQIDFTNKSNVTGTWTMIVVYGVEYPTV